MADIWINTGSFTAASASGTDAPSSGTSQDWDVVALAAEWPDLTGGHTMTVIDAELPSEYLRITASTGSGATSITITRGADGSTPVEHTVGATYTNVVLASAYNAFGAGGVTSLEGLTGAVTFDSPDSSLTFGTSGSEVTAKVTDDTFDAYGAAAAAQSAAEAASLPISTDLSAIATANPTAASWSNNDKRIEDVQGGSASGQVATFDQLPTDVDQLTLAGESVSSSSPFLGDGLFFNGTEWIAEPVPESVPGNTTVFGQTVTPYLPNALNDGPTYPFSLLFDSSGDLFVTYNDGATNGVLVWSPTAQTLFDQDIPANTPTILTATAGNLNGPQQAALNSNGDLFITSYNGDKVFVLPATTRTLFGQDVTAGELAVLTVTEGSSSLVGIACDAADNLYYNTPEGVNVLPVASGTIFGQGVTANTVVALTALAGTLTDPGLLTFDPAGNLWITQYSNPGKVVVLPAASGDLFGQSFTINTPAQFTPVGTLTACGQLTFDTEGNLYVTQSAANTIVVVPVATGVLYYQNVTENTGVALTMATDLSTPFGMAIDAKGDIFVANSIASNGVIVFPVASSAGGVSSHQLLEALATPDVAIGTPWQNTLGVSLNVIVSVVVTAATGASFASGVSGSSTPVTDPLLASFTSSGAVISWTFTVPPLWWLSIETSGTITIGSVTTSVNAA